jgi:iron complex outermembrane receptor protein/vitamin B12 transporter
MKVRRPRCILGAALIALSGLLQTPARAAQEGEPEQPTESAASSPSSEAPVIFETAVVEARPLDNATASVTVVDRETIESLDVRTVAEIIPYVSGLFLVHNGPTGGVATAVVRGGDPNFTLVLLDGVPLNDSTDQFGGSVNLNSLPASQVERLEIVRTPASSFYGSNGMAGVINVITRRGEAEEPRWEVAAAAGNNAYGQAAASLSRATERSDYFVGLSWQTVEGEVADDSFEQFVAQGNGGVTLGARSKLNLNGRVTTWQGDDFQEGCGGILGSGETRSSDHQELALGAELDIGPEERQHRVYTTLYRHDLERDSPGCFDPATFQGFPPSTEDTQYGELRAGWNYPAYRSQRTRVSVGAEVDHQDGENRSILVGLGPADYSLDRTIGAGYVEVVNQRGSVLLELAARVDVPDGSDAELNPRAGLSWSFNDKGRLRFSLARAFKLPSFFALGTPVGGNPDLRPEVTLGGDVGVEYGFARNRVRTGFAIFYYEYQDLIDFDFDSFMLVNQDTVESRGAELDVTWTASDRIELGVDVTRQNVEIVETGEKHRNRPDWIGGARFNWRIGSRLRWEVDGQWVSSSRDLQVAQTREEVDGYQLLGTALRFRLTPNWGLDGRVDNLLDEEYETMVGFPGPGRRFKVGFSFRSR